MPTQVVETPAERKIGDVIGTKAEYEVPNELKNITNVKTAYDVMGQPLKEGQYLGHFGTTVYNMNPSSPEYEAKYGKKVYKERIEPNSPKAMREKQSELENIIKAQQKQIDNLVTLMAAKEKVEQKAEPEPAQQLLEDMSLAEIRATAKGFGINCFQKSKEQLVREIKEKI